MIKYLTHFNVMDVAIPLISHKGDRKRNEVV